jgi:DNA primase
MLRGCQERLTESAEGYLLGRGLTEQAIVDLEIGIWEPTSAAPMGDFRKRYEPAGQRIAGWLVCPLRDGRGGLLGFEARCMTEKAVTEYKLPRAFWNPVFIGLSRAMPRIWDGADVWIGEGLFDMGALEHIVPDRDVTLAALTAKINLHHVRFLSRFVRGTVHLVFDRDAKGRKATVGYTNDEGKWRRGAIDSMERVGIRCRDVGYRCPPGCKDPGDIWEQYGDEGLRRAFHNSV